MDFYLVNIIVVDKDDNIKTINKIFHRQQRARIEFLSLQDILRVHLATFYKVSFEDFDIEEFGDIEINDDYMTYKDFEGLHNVRIELKTI